MPDRGGDQAADGVVLVVVEIGIEAFVEVVDRRQRIDHEQAVGLRSDQRMRIFGIVVFVVDLADDLFEHVLDRDQTGDAAVFVDHDRHVVARLAELAQQHVEALGFGNQHRWAQQRVGAVRAIVGDHAAQQVLGQQDAEDLVLVLAVHRETRMAGFDHALHQFQQRGLGGQGHHLRARDHHVADGEVGNGDRAFHHSQGVGGDQAIGLGIAQQFDQIFAGAGFAGKHRADALQPAAPPFLRRPSWRSCAVLLSSSDMVFR